MKKIFLCMISMLLSMSVDAYRSVSKESSKEVLSSTLGKAFLRVSDLETFEPIKNAEDLDNSFYSLELLTVW